MNAQEILVFVGVAIACALWYWLGRLDERKKIKDPLDLGKTPQGFE
jgi:membrane protein DedA with SNARE-associated domain